MKEIIKGYNAERKLKILSLEDSDVDFMLMSLFLEDLEVPYQLKRVENEAGFVDALVNYSPDIVLSDYNLPSFDGLDALELTNQHCPDIPFIFVTGFLGEERAVETLKKGATDFILKDNLVRLSKLIVRSLSECEARRSRDESEAALRQSEAKYRQLMEQAADGILLSDPEWRYIEVNSKACKMLGYTREELLGLKIQDIVPPGTPSPVESLQQMEAGEDNKYETYRMRKDGSVFPVEINVSKTPEGNFQAIIRDISQRKKAQQALEVALSKLEFYLINSPLAVLEMNHSLVITKWSGQAEKMFGWKEEEVLGKSVFRVGLTFQEDWCRIKSEFEKKQEEGVWYYIYPMKLYTKKGTTTHCISYNSISFDKKGNFHSVLSLINDVTVEKLEAEAKDEWRVQERKRVAREIHEGIGQMLVASKFKAASIDVSGPNAEEGISQVESLLERTIEEVRRISLNMAPRSVEELGIENAIRQLCKQLEQTTGIKVTFSYSWEGSAAGNNVLATIFRIVQEVLNNAIKHAHASEIIVELNQRMDKIELKVKDNGRGFEVNKVDINKTSGLRNIKERISLLGGSLQIISNGTEGTQIIGCLPVNDHLEKLMESDMVGE